jgi:hypothetical protein
MVFAIRAWIERDPLHQTVANRESAIGQIDDRSGSIESRVNLAPETASFVKPNSPDTVKSQSVVESRSAGTDVKLRPDDDVSRAESPAVLVDISQD